MNRGTHESKFHLKMKRNHPTDRRIRLLRHRTGYATRSVLRRLLMNKLVPLLSIDMSQNLRSMLSIKDIAAVACTSHSAHATTGGGVLRREALREINRCVGAKLSVENICINYNEIPLHPVEPRDLPHWTTTDEKQRTYYPFAQKIRLIVTNRLDGAFSVYVEPFALHPGLGTAHRAIYRITLLGRDNDRISKLGDDMFTCLHLDWGWTEFATSRKVREGKFITTDGKLHFTVVVCVVNMTLEPICRRLCPNESVAFDSVCNRAASRLELASCPSPDTMPVLNPAAHHPAVAPQNTGN